MKVDRRGEIWTQVLIWWRQSWWNCLVSTKCIIHLYRSLVGVFTVYHIGSFASIANGIYAVKQWLLFRTQSWYWFCSLTMLPLLTDIVDTKPANMEDLTEVITAAQFHPTECGLFVYSSSKGLLRLCDLRSQALCDRNAKGAYCLLSYIYNTLHDQLHFYS